MPDPLSPVGLVVRALLLAGILLAIGAIGFRYLVIRRIARSSEDNTFIVSRLEERTAALGALGAAIVLLGAILRLWLQARSLADPLSGGNVDYRFLLLGTIWGKAWIAQAAAALLALIAFRLCRRPRNWWMAAALASLVLAFTPAFSGHAIGSERGTTIAVLADGLHTLAAGGWIGAMALLGACLFVPRQAGNPALGVAMIAAFSPLALGAAATVAASGVVSSVLHVGSVEALTSSRYGRTLLVKVGLVFAVVLLGAFNWKRAGPQVIQQADERPMLTSIRAELVVSLLVLLATAALIVTPPPGEE